MKAFANTFLYSATTAITLVCANLNAQRDNVATMAHVADDQGLPPVVSSAAVDGSRYDGPVAENFCDSSPICARIRSPQPRRPIGSSTCDGACGCGSCAPLWTSSADALFLRRRDPGDSVLAFNTANPAESFNASDFRFGVHTGFDVSLLRQIGCKNSLELRYFGVDDWDSSISLPSTPGALLQLNSAVPVFTFSGTGIDANYASELHSSEFNWRRNISDWLTLLSGFRYAELDELAAGNLVGSAVPFSYTVGTRNRLYGHQIGGEALLWNRRYLTVTGFGKAGIYVNRSAQDSSVSTGLVTLPTSGRDDRTAFIGETGLRGAVRMTDFLFLRGGYRLLWLDGMALATEQLAVSDFANGTGFSRSGDVFYHGAFAGLELRY